MTFLLWVFAIWMVSLGITLTIVKDEALREWKKGYRWSVVYSIFTTSLLWWIFAIKELTEKK